MLMQESAQRSVANDQTDGQKKQHRQQKSTPFLPFLNIIPSEDGTEIFIRAANIEIIDSSVTALVTGPTSFREGWTMTYSDTVQAFITTVTGFSPTTTTEGTITITTTLGLETSEIGYSRAYVTRVTNQTVRSADGNLELSLINTATLPANTYIAIAPSYSPPEPAPTGHHIIGSVYSLRAAGALAQADKPMNLRLHYTEQLLNGTDPRTLAIFAWDAFHKRWDNLGGRHFSEQKYLSLTIKHFLTYALMATPTWRDDFDDFGGLDLDSVSNIAQGGTLAERTLMLTNSPGKGSAVSQWITLPDGADEWGMLTYESAVDPPTATLTIDLLSMDGDLIWEDVPDDQNLVQIDVAQHPSLHLRVNITSTLSGESPALDAWQITWHTELVDRDCNGVADEQQAEIGSCLFLPLLSNGD
ncbi:MAG: hypothetical protein AAF702_32505 [Chloroflexota bacterium]